MRAPIYRVGACWVPEHQYAPRPTPSQGANRPRPLPERGELKIIAATLEQPARKKMLTHLGLRSLWAAAISQVGAADYQLCGLKSRLAKIDNVSSAGLARHARAGTNHQLRRLTKRI
jgi:hypothetical protein